jgi:hypothetical protein
VKEAENRGILVQAPAVLLVGFASVGIQASDTMEVMVTPAGPSMRQKRWPVPFRGSGREAAIRRNRTCLERTFQDASEEVGFPFLVLALALCGSNRLSSLFGDRNAVEKCRFYSFWEIAAQNHLSTGEKAKAHDILAAIRVLKTVEREQRPATDDEMQALRRFGGFGPVARSIFPDPVTGQYKLNAVSLRKPRLDRPPPESDSPGTGGDAPRRRTGSRPSGPTPARPLAHSH